jgi:hypothetical protein
MRFIAESSLSLLSEAHVKRLRRNGFGALLPGIEFWHDLGNKSNRGVHRRRQAAPSGRSGEHDAALRSFRSRHSASTALSASKAAESVFHREKAPGFTYR